MKIKNIQIQRKDLSEKPVVYVFRDKDKKILYIGKATSLRNRVGSYFSGTHNYRIEKMISQIKKIEVKETDTVLEALILEANLIKKHQPRYNVKEKDDKSFSYFVITKEEFPRILILRETEIELKESERSDLGYPRSDLSDSFSSISVSRKIKIRGNSSFVITKYEKLLSSFSLTLYLG